MRDIKFRAWDKKKNDWFDEDRGQLYIELNGNINFGWNGELMDDCTDRIILMQYTGLKDKKGVGIYEGDIVKFDARSHYHPEVYAWEYQTRGVGIIRYEMGSYILEGREESHILESLFGMLMNYEEIEMEVIGNIYQNKDLLED